MKDSNEYIIDKIISIAEKWKHYTKIPIDI